MTRLLKEPLVHFVFLAVLIFGGYAWVTSDRGAAERTIVITQADMERLAALYAVEAGTLPTEQDMRAIISDQIQQQALAREARRLGMADGDTVVERRLAQKMTFMISDVSEVEPPSDDVLEAWLQENATRFEQPLRLSFQHVFFSDPSDARIGTVLSDLNADPAADWRNVGDPFMLQRSYAELPLREIVRVFGAAFAGELAPLEADTSRWTGPVSSALGVHLVRVSARSDSGMPALDEIRSAVIQDWRDEEQRRRTAAEIDAIVSRYEVEIEGVTDN